MTWQVIKVLKMHLFIPLQSEINDIPISDDRQYCLISANEMSFILLCVLLLSICLNTNDLSFNLIPISKKK